MRAFAPASALLLSFLVACPDAQPPAKSTLAPAPAEPACGERACTKGEACCTVRDASGAIRQGCAQVVAKEVDVKRTCAAFGAERDGATTDLATCTVSGDCERWAICATNPSEVGVTTITGCDIARISVLAEACRSNGDCAQAMECRKSPDDCFAAPAAYCELPRCLSRTGSRCGGLVCAKEAPICCVGGAFGAGRCATQAGCDAANANRFACVTAADCGPERECCVGASGGAALSSCMLVCFNDEMNTACESDKDCHFDVEPHCKPATLPSAPPGLKTCQP